MSYVTVTPDTPAAKPVKLSMIEQLRCRSIRDVMLDDACSVYDRIEMMRFAVRDCGYTGDLNFKLGELSGALQKIIGMIDDLSARNFLEKGKW